MAQKKIAYIVANFGGPRQLEEIEPFLRELLTDRDVIRTKLPSWIHQWLFSRIAKKRAKKIAADYESIGGKSPIFEDTEAIASAVRKSLRAAVLVFHRYLPETHLSFLAELEALEADEIQVFPMFPQFSYATTGSIARWFSKHLSPKVQRKLFWIKSYATHPAFIAAWQRRIRDCLKQNGLQDEETILLFSAHGLPKEFIETGDLYERECELSFQEIAAEFPSCLNKLAYQSKFGTGEWLRPQTDELCQQILDWSEGRKAVVFVPLSFTSDHIETLFEVEQLYLPPVRERGLTALRCPAFGPRPDWIAAIESILEHPDRLANQMLVRIPTK